MTTAAGPRPVRVVLVDDHQMVVMGLRAVFATRPEVEVAAWAHDAETGLAACREHHPDVAIVDVGLEGSALDGMGVCRRLAAELPTVRVVLYTGLEERGLAERALAAGARGIVPKSDRTGDILRAVLLAARDRSYVSPIYAARAEQRDFPELPPKQLTVLRLLAQGLERRQIADQMGVGEETVKTHLTEVRRRLGARTSAQAVAIGLYNALFEYDGAPEP